ncbi:MAG TPA: hypothetical protein VF630_14380 [Hymenobacter sp.]|jgi:hypothetical protein
MLLKTCLLLAASLTAATLETPLLAQTAPIGPFRTEAEAAQHKAGFLTAAEKAGYVLQPDFFYRNRLDVTKTKALRRVGVDLLRMDRSMLIDGAPDFPSAPMYSDLAVHGTIIRATGDTSRTAYYHAAFTVRVSEAWQGRAPADTVVVRLRSGPLGAGQLHESMEPELAQGQEVVLFLSPVDFAGYAEAEKQGLASLKNNALPGDFNLVKAIKVKNGRVFGGKVKLARARKYSQRIAAILDKEHFYQKEF